jgi:hypothetical protein
MGSVCSTHEGEAECMCDSGGKARMIETVRLKLGG